MDVPCRVRGESLRILGSRVATVTSQEALDQIFQFLQLDQLHHVITGNTLMCLAAEHDAELWRILERAALVVPESSGIQWASRVLGKPLKEFTPGIDLMLGLCRMAQLEGKSIYLVGSAPGVAEAAKQALLHTFPRLTVAGVQHGYFDAQDEPSLIQRIQVSKPDILFVGMGMPAQEKWIARNLTALGVPVVMGVGGSFDVLSGKLKRAPGWMRRSGIEWMYRLAQEPWRWRRIMQLPVFAWKVIQQTRHGKRQM